MAYSVNSYPGKEITFDGIAHLYFGGTSYLGLQTDTQFQNILIDSIKKYGTNYGASRKANVQISIFRKVEEHLASLVGSQDCITLSSGYLAGQLVAQTLESANHDLFYAPDTHAAVQISVKNQFKSYEDLNSAVRSHLQKSKSTPVIFLDTLDTECLNYPDFNALRQLPLDQVIIVADDSHGIGIVGSKGGGSYQSLKKLQPKEIIICCSLGKGFGIQAGAIFGQKQRINKFTETDFFGGASPASPANLATLLSAKGIFEDKQALLQKHIQLFKSSVKDISQFKFSPNHPAFGFSNAKLLAHLKAKNIIITSFNYPSENASLMSRIVLSASHTKNDINYLSEVINNL